MLLFIVPFVWNQALMFLRNEDGDGEGNEFYWALWLMPFVNVYVCQYICHAG